MTQEEIKLIVVGGGNVGKSALTIMYTQNMFIEEYDPTIEDSYRKQTTIDEVVCLVDILDTAGCEGFLASAFASHQVSASHACIVVYSITSFSSFNEVKAYRDRVLQFKNIPIYLVGNKCDLETERQVTKAEGEELSKTFQCPFVETSAKKGTNMDVPFVELSRMILQQRKENHTLTSRKKQKCNIL